jgi:4-aminobutyrate--pyruvate transaminase
LAASLEQRILSEAPDTVAAMIVEPIMGAGGVLPPPATYFEKIQAVLKKYEVLLIADEVICGFGRTGNTWGTTTFGLSPDMMSCAKAMSSGYLPIGAVTVSQEIYGGAQPAVRENRRLQPRLFEPWVIPFPSARRSSSMKAKSI